MHYDSEEDELKKSTKLTKRRKAVQKRSSKRMKPVVNNTWRAKPKHR